MSQPGPSKAGAGHLLRSYFALERELVLVSAAMLLLGFGENLWRKFVPKFLEALGAPILVIGWYGTAQDFIDGIYQYPGGWLSDRLGRRRALQLLIAAATMGYLVYLLAPSWPVVFVGLLLVMAWQSMGSPTLFAVVGDVLPRDRRAMGFTVQAILRRLPIAIAPLLGGLLIAHLGVLAGFRAATAVAVATGVLSLAVVGAISLPRTPWPDRNLAGVWGTFPPSLRRLLLSDIFVRICEGMVDVFLVLWAVNVVGLSAPQFGLLILVQMTTSILAYLPAAHWSDRIARKPFVTATFLAFAAFPLAVVASHSFGALVLAYVVGGLREVGEPSRKAMIVDLVDPRLRGRSVGLYYLTRSLAVSPAALAGGFLWSVQPSLPFVVAAATGLIGTVLFLLTVHDYRGP
jgi:MFS family permease